MFDNGEVLGTNLAVPATQVDLRNVVTSRPDYEDRNGGPRTNVHVVVCHLRAWWLTSMTSRVVYVNYETTSYKYCIYCAVVSLLFGAQGL